MPAMFSARSRLAIRTAGRAVSQGIAVGPSMNPFAFTYLEREFP